MGMLDSGSGAQGVQTATGARARCADVRYERVYEYPTGGSCLSFKARTGIRLFFEVNVAQCVRPYWMSGHMSYIRNCRNTWSAIVLKDRAVTALAFNVASSLGCSQKQRIGHSSQNLIQLQNNKRITTKM